MWRLILKLYGFLYVKNIWTWNILRCLRRLSFLCSSTDLEMFCFWTMIRQSQRLKRENASWHLIVLNVYFRSHWFRVVEPNALWIVAPASGTCRRRRRNLHIFVARARSRDAIWSRDRWASRARCALSKGLSTLVVGEIDLPDIVSHSVATDAIVAGWSRSSELQPPGPASPGLPQSYGYSPDATHADYFFCVGERFLIARRPAEKKSMPLWTP